MSSVVLFLGNVREWAELLWSLILGILRVCFNRFSTNQLDHFDGIGA